MKPKYEFGQILRDEHGFVGRVNAMYENYASVVNSFCVPPEWFEMQTKPPSTKSQIFYSIVALDGRGEVLVGENDASLTPPIF